MRGVNNESSIHNISRTCQRIRKTSKHCKSEVARYKGRDYFLAVWDEPDFNFEEDN